MTATETRAAKAKALRYKKPIVRDLNYESIREYLDGIQNECYDIQDLIQDDNALLDALDGSEDEAYEFQMMFSDLQAECETMLEDMDDWRYTDDDEELCNLFFVAVQAGDSYGGYDGYDEAERDYYGLDAWDSRQAVDAATKRLERLTKSELIDRARRAFRLYQGYVGLRYRYDCLEASFEILKDKNTGHLQTIRAIEDLYNRADASSNGFAFATDETRELDRLVGGLPDEMWIW